MLAGNTVTGFAHGEAAMQKSCSSLLWLGIVALFAQSPPPNPVIRVPARLVTVPTLVFSKNGHLISGLQKNDFRVFDNGQMQATALDTASAPVSVVLAIQQNRDVRDYVPFIRKAGATIETLLLGESSESAVIAYGDDLTTLKPFESGDLQSALREFPPAGRRVRLIDAGMRGIALLRERPAARTRVLIFIGQSMDSGSESVLSPLKEQAERENVAVYALALPEFGKAFVSDTFSLQAAPSGQRGGFQAGVDLGNLVSVLGRKSKMDAATDPFSLLTTATGGTQIHFRKQNEFENAIASIGEALRSAYVLSFAPGSTEAGYHAIKVEVDVAGAKTYSRAGYWLGPNF